MEIKYPVTGEDVAKMVGQWDIYMASKQLDMTSSKCVMGTGNFALDIIYQREYPEGYDTAKKRNPFVDKKIIEEPARREFAESMDIYRELADQTPDAYLPHLARVMGKLELYYHDMCQYDLEEQELEKAISIYRKLGDESSETYMPDLANMLGALAHNHLRTDKIEQAERDYLEAADIYRKLKMDANFLKNLKSELVKELKEKRRM